MTITIKIVFPSGLLQAYIYRTLIKLISVLLYSAALFTWQCNLNIMLRSHRETGPFPLCFLAPSTAPCIS